MCGEHGPEFIQSSTIHEKERPVLLNVLIQIIDKPHILEKVQGLIKEVSRSREPCLINGTREYVVPQYSFDNTLTRISNLKKTVKRIALLFIRPCDRNLMKYI